MLVMQIQPSIPTEGHTLGSLTPAELIRHIGPAGVIPIPSKIHVYSASSRGRRDMNTGDKIVLSQHVMISCFQQELNPPIVSCLHNHRVCRL